MIKQFNSRREWRKAYYQLNRMKENARTRAWWRNNRAKCTRQRTGMSIKALGRAEYNRRYWLAKKAAV